MHTPTLLLVDDADSAPARLVRKFGLGDATITASGADALALAARHSFDAVLASRRAQPPNGISLLREIAHLAPGCQRILMSPYSDLAGLPEAMGQGIVHVHLPLPVDLRQLRALVERVRVRGGNGGPAALVMANPAMLARFEAVLANDEIPVWRAGQGHAGQDDVGAFSADVWAYQTEVTPALLAAVRQLAGLGPALVESTGGRSEAPLRTALSGPSSGPGEAMGALREMVSAFERRVIADVLKRHGGNRTRAAKALGMSRQGLALKLKKLAP